jgi:hypothetical protein
MTNATKQKPWALLPLPAKLADGLRLEGVSWSLGQCLLQFAPNELVPPL